MSKVWRLIVQKLVYASPYNPPPYPKTQLSVKALSVKLSTRHRHVREAANCLSPPPLVSSHSVLAATLQSLQTVPVPVLTEKFVVRNFKTCFTQGSKLKSEDWGDYPPPPPRNTGIIEQHNNSSTTPSKWLLGLFVLFCFRALVNQSKPDMGAPTHTCTRACARAHARFFKKKKLSAVCIF